MLRLRSIVYRYLTDADFFNINKPSGTEAQGGGQSYIDFSTVDVPVKDWTRFFDGVADLQETQVAQGPKWTFPIGSIGVAGEPPQTCEVYQRRPQSVIIARQKLGTSQSNRVRAWHPARGFPRPIDPANRHQCPDGLVVFLARTDDAVWAGWFLNDGRSPLPFVDEAVRPLLTPLLAAPANEDDPRAAMFPCVGLMLDETDARTPFRMRAEVPKPAPPVQRMPAAEESEEAVAALFEEDVAGGAGPPAYSIAKVRKRNTKAVSALKELYRNICQITGTEFLFQKRDGTYYVEAHHLIPLGEGGADDPRNMVVLSPQLHKMLHHATVGPIDLSKMQRAPDGRSFVDVTINDKPYRIHWHPTHAKLIQDFDE
jgi:5-methylcytosine-specific restriction protein A